VESTAEGLVESTAESTAKSTAEGLAESTAEGLMESTAKRCSDMTSPHRMVGCLVILSYSYEVVRVRLCFSGEGCVCEA
jgi:hypothetical protein